jgi:hypothetical protein
VHLLSTADQEIPRCTGAGIFATVIMNYELYSVGRTLNQLNKVSVFCALFLSLYTLLPHKRYLLISFSPTFLLPSWILYVAPGSSVLVKSYINEHPGSRIGIDSPPSNAEVKNDWSYTSTPPVCLHGVYGENFTFTFISLPNLFLFGDQAGN